MNMTEIAAKRLKEFNGSERKTVYGAYTGRITLTVLKLLTLLSTGRYTVHELEDQMDVKQRTIQRLLKLFEDTNLSIDQDFNGKYFIADDSCPLCNKGKCNQQHTTNL